MAAASVFGVLSIILRRYNSALSWTKIRRDLGFGNAIARFTTTKIWRAITNGARRYGSNLRDRGARASSNSSKSRSRMRSTITSRSTGSHAKGLAAGGPHVFNYKIYWGPDVPTSWSGARVVKTRVGGGKKPGSVVFVIDLTGPLVKDAKDLPAVDLSASAGKISNVSVQRNLEISGVRVTFELAPGDSQLVELRCVLKAGDQAVSETWLYRWTKP